MKLIFPILLLLTVSCTRLPFLPKLPEAPAMETVLTHIPKDARPLASAEIITATVADDIADVSKEIKEPQAKARMNQMEAQLRGAVAVINREAIRMQEITSGPETRFRWLVQAGIGLGAISILVGLVVGWLLHEIRWVVSLCGLGISLIAASLLLFKYITVIVMVFGLLALLICIFIAWKHRKLIHDAL